MNVFTLWCSFYHDLSHVCLYDMSRVRCFIFYILQCLVVFTVSLMWPALLSLFGGTFIFSSWSYGKINAYKKHYGHAYFGFWRRFWVFYDSLNKSCEFLLRLMCFRHVALFVLSHMTPGQSGNICMNSSDPNLALNLLHEWFSIHRSKLLWFGSDLHEENKFSFPSR